MDKMSKKSRHQQQDANAKLKQEKLEKCLKNNESKEETKIEIDSWDVSN